MTLYHHEFYLFLSQGLLSYSISSVFDSCIVISLLVNPRNFKFPVFIFLSHKQSQRLIWYCVSVYHKKHWFFLFSDQWRSFLGINFHSYTLTNSFFHNLEVMNQSRWEIFHRTFCCMHLLAQLSYPNFRDSVSSF